MVKSKVNPNPIAYNAVLPPREREVAPTFATYYNPNIDLGISFEGEVSLTKQSFAEELDINGIVAKGLVPPPPAEQQYADVSDLQDYRAALDIVRDAADHFESLPAIVRRKFGNDPAEFLDWINNPSNQKEAVELGLATERAAPTPTPPPTKTAVTTTAKKPSKPSSRSDDDENS